MKCFFHIWHATIAQFYVVFVKNFVVFVAGWIVFIEKGKKFFANISGDFIIKRRVEPNNLSCSVS